MNVSQLVVELNNKAIQFLAEGNWDAAVAALSAALSSLQLSQEVATMATPPLCAELSRALKLLESTASLGSHTRISSKELNHECFVECSGSFSIFNHVLTIPNASELDANVSKNYERIQAMLLYNLGLTLHFHGMRTGRSAELQGALDIYEMAFHVVEVSLPLINIQDVILLLLALLNNLGHIHASLHNRSQTKRCIDWLKGLAEHPGFLNIIQQEQYAVFSMNLLVVLKQFDEQHCSPAA